jgi:hypothetical protein
MSKLMAKTAVVVAVIALAAGCADREKPAPGTSGNPVPSAASSSSSTESAAASTGANALSVFATEPAKDTFTLDTAGVRSLPAGQALITFKNLGASTHELRLVKITDGNFGAYRSALLADPIAAQALGTEVGSSPGVEQGISSTFGADLSAGTYALVCLLNAPDGKTFAQHGMIRELVVSAG